LLISFAFFCLLWIVNISFDVFWEDASTLPLTNLNDVYNPPKEYDKEKKINIKLQGLNKISIEGNSRFKRIGSNKPADIYDTVEIYLPQEEYSTNNHYYFQFENSSRIDSVYLVVSKSDKKDFFWKQIFFSSVFINQLNNFSESSDNFRINENMLVENKILENNDTLINWVYSFYNNHLDSIGFSECGTNSSNFKAVCVKFNVPCRIISLQGGDANKPGFNNQLGYPLHVICEIYSSKFNKWFVVDPSYGFIYIKDKIPLSAVEISNKVFFNREKEISQDSILTTKRSLLGRDYFKYYENLFFTSNYKLDLVTAKLGRMFFGKFNPKVFQYSNNLNTLKNGYYYVGLKSVIYLLIMIISVNFVVFLLSKRLYNIKQLNRNLNN
jgi:hypothetical protein